jgi:hypothetical protein
LEGAGPLHVKGFGADRRDLVEDRLVGLFLVVAAVTRFCSSVTGRFSSVINCSMIFEESMPLMRPVLLVMEAMCGGDASQPSRYPVKGDTVVAQPSVTSKRATLLSPQPSEPHVTKASHR